MNDVTGKDWSGGEIDLIVADYFAMLREELAGRSVNKSQHNKALQALIRRSHASIEFKHQNISAVLKRLGYPWIKGYKPRVNFQGALIDGVERYLNLNGNVEASVFEEADMAAIILPIIFEPAPALAPLDEKAEAPMRRLIRKFDPAQRDARNRALGMRGEERVFQAEIARLTSAERKDLALKVEWTSQERGDGAGYDIRSFATDGSERLLEVKTTLGHNATPFYLTENERLVSEERPDAYRIIRLYNFARQPRGFRMSPPWERHFTLSPTAYRASFH